MGITILNDPGAFKRFKRTAWEYQLTFKTPLKDLHRFVGTILSDLGDMKSGVITIDSVVFPPRYGLAVLFARHSQTPQLLHEQTLTVCNVVEAAELLEAVLSEWIDFMFVPTPKSFVMYADHDEYATFLAHTKSNLNRIVKPLLEQGFRQVDYQRHI